MDDNSPPEVTIEPADNGFVVRHHQRSTKKNEHGRTIRRVASTTEEALGHAKSALGGAKPAKKRSIRGGAVGSDAESDSDSGGAAGSVPGHRGISRARARRSRHRTTGRR